MSCPKTLVLVNSVYLNNVLNACVHVSDPGDTTSKVSCCVEPSMCFKNRDFDAIVKGPLALRK